MSARLFVESLSNHQILNSSELSTVRGQLTEGELEKDAEHLAKDLIKQGKLTKYQAANIYNGRGKGLVFGEYVLLDKLGAGGMGQVFKAQHRRMKRLVALKVLPPHATSAAKNVQRFYQEVEMAAKLNHPNIVTAYDASESHGLHYLVMEYVEGADLASIVAKQGPLSVEQAVNVIKQAAQGLAYAHGQNIIHRDIKPANLLFDKQGVVKILDMGLARLENPLADSEAGQGELTESGQIMGTVDYMAPEQAQDTRAADSRADIYSLGCTLYRLLTGKVTYSGDTTIKKILAHRDQTIPKLRDLRPDVPEGLDRLFERMVAKKPTDRIQPMGAVVEALERLSINTDDESSSINIGAELHAEGGSDELHSFLNAMSGPGNSVIKKAARQAQTEQLNPDASTDPGKREGKQGKSASKPTAAKKLPIGVLIGAGAVALLVVGIVVAMSFSGGKEEVAIVDGPVNPAISTSTPPKVELPATNSGPIELAPKPSPLQPKKSPPPPPKQSTSPTPAKTDTPSTPTNPTPPGPPPPTPKQFFGSSEPNQPTLKPGEPFDLLNFIDLPRDQVSGNWRRDPDGLINTEPLPFVRLQVPLVPPRDYLLVIDLTNVGGPGREVVLGLILAGKAVGLKLDAYGGQFCGLSMVDGNDASSNESSKRISVIYPGTPSHAVVMVRGQTIKVMCNGEIAIDWTGDPERLQIPTSIQGIRKDCLVFGGFQSLTKFHRAELIPLPEGSAGDALVEKYFQVPKTQEISEPIDALKLVNPKQHGGPAWSAIPNGIMVDPLTRDKVLTVPLQVPVNCDFRVVMEPGDSNHRIGVVVPIGNQHVGVQNTRSEYWLSRIDNQESPNHPTSRTSPGREPNRPVEWVVSLRGNMFRLSVNGRPVIFYRHENATIGTLPYHKVSPRHFGIMGDLGTKITKIEVLPPDPHPLAPQAIDVLSTLNVQTDTQGEWHASQGEWRLPNQRVVGQFPRVLWSAYRSDRYRVRAVVQRDEGHQGIRIGLPYAGNRRAMAVVGINGVTAFNLQGTLLGSNETTRIDPTILMPGYTSTIDCIVDRDRFSLIIDGRQVSSWPTTSRMEDDPSWRVSDVGQFYLGAIEQAVRLARLTLTPLDWQRRPIPKTDELADAVREIEPLTTPKGTSTEAKLALIEPLYRYAAASTDRPALAFAALEQAQRLAFEAGDLSVALSAAERLDEEFDIEADDRYRLAITESNKNAKSIPARQQWEADAFEWYDRAVGTERFALAQELQSALVSSIKPVTTDRAKEVKIRGTEVALWRQEWEQCEAARSKLAGGDDSPETHLAIGRFWTLVYADYARALPHLEKGGDPLLLAAVKKEIDQPKTTDQMVDMADAWWALAEPAAVPLKWIYQERGGEWHRRATLSGPLKSKTTVDARRSQVATQRKASGGAFGKRHPLDAVKIGDHWYKLIHSPTRWERAAIAAEQLGGTLPICDSVAEQQAVCRYAATFMGNAPGFAFWIGVTDREKEGDFRWVDGSSVTRSPGVVQWGANEPNRTDPNEDYVGIVIEVRNNQQNVKWADFNDTFQMPFIVEWDQ